MSERIGSIVIEGVAPAVDGGRYAVKRVVGDEVLVSVDLFKEGHDVLAGVVRHRALRPLPATGASAGAGAGVGASPPPAEWREAPLTHVGNDRWTGRFLLDRVGRHVFTVEAWPDLFASWASELSRKVAVGRDVRSELLEGAALLRAASQRAQHVSAPESARLAQAAQLLGGEPSQAVAAALDPALAALASRHPDRSLGSRTQQEYPVYADRARARFGSWYEFFPRSAARDGKRHGTFADAEALLPEIAAMGFDVVYLPPIHPIGKTARKGRNNSLTAAPEDPGSPWAIGSAEGGHKAVHPRLGTLDDFRRFVKRAQEHGIEVALDIAFQASPDHPYLKEHPEWFHRRPDGTIKTAENPPKRYEDIVNFDFLGPARKALWEELRSVFLFWIDQGVKLFRVDNPHTKPVAFWEWVIREVQERHPDAVFLSEAFTRPKMMNVLAKVGFSQSYTYFTWRNFKPELEQYLTELSTPPMADFFRPNFWPNTPDILPELLQQGGPGAFRLRLMLAGTLVPSYGIYSGYELCEGRALPGKEEYQDSEKYQLVAWDPNRPGNIRDFVTRLNRIRRAHPALQEDRNLRFHRADNERVIFYSRVSRDGMSRLLVAVSLDPYTAQEAVLHLPLELLSLPEDEVFQVHELMTDQRSLWQGRTAHVRLSPDQPAAIWSVLRFSRRESSFDYYL